MKSYKGKRVLLLCTASSIGGTERVVMLQARGLNALGVETRTIIAESERTAATLAWFESEGVEAESNPAVLDVHVPRSREDMIKLAQLVRGWRPDAVSLHYGVNHISIRDVLAIRYGRAKRLVVTVHHPSPLDEMSSRTHKISRIASKLITKLVCLTDALRNQMLTIGVSPGKIAQFTYAIPPPKTYPDRLQSRAKFGIPADAFVVSSLARIELEKGFRELLEAAALVPDPEGKLRVVIAGSGPALDEIRALGKELLGDRAIITGRVDDPAEVYAASDVFALPSYLEGFGLVYIEAAFHWLPSIGTNIGGIPEAIVDGETGLLVPVKDVPATAEAIRKLWGDPELRTRLGEAARARAITDFTVDAFNSSSAKVLLG